jgi:hypothetical protein
MRDLTYLLSILVGLGGFPIITLAAEAAGKVVFASGEVKAVDANDLHRALTRGDRFLLVTLLSPTRIRSR